MKFSLELCLLMLYLFRDGFKLGGMLGLELGLVVNEGVKLLLEFVGVCLEFCINFGLQH